MLGPVSVESSEGARGVNNLNNNRKLAKEGQHAITDVEVLEKIKLRACWIVPR